MTGRARLVWRSGWQARAIVEPFEAAFHDVSLPVDLLVEGQWSSAVAALGGPAGDLVGPFRDGMSDAAAAQPATVGSCAYALSAMSMSGLFRGRPGPVGSRTGFIRLTCDFVRGGPFGALSLCRHERVAGLPPAAASGAAVVGPTWPRRGRQGCRAAGATPSGRGPSSVGTPSRLEPTDRVVLAALSRLPSPPALADLRHAGNAAAVAPRVGRPPLDVPARPFRAATPCPAGPRPGAAADRRESDPATSAHPRRAGRARLPGVGQHGVERAAPGRRRTRALARTRTPNAGWARSGANASTGSSSPANDIW
jgi:hypothetical protein